MHYDGLIVACKQLKSQSGSLAAAAFHQRVQLFFLLHFISTFPTSTCTINGCLRNHTYSVNIKYKHIHHGDSLQFLFKELPEHFFESKCYAQRSHLLEVNILSSSLKGEHITILNTQTFFILQLYLTWRTTLQ